MKANIHEHLNKFKDGLGSLVNEGSYKMQRHKEVYVSKQSLPAQLSDQKHKGLFLGHSKKTIKKRIKEINIALEQLPPQHDPKTLIEEKEGLELRFNEMEHRLNKEKVENPQNTSKTKKKRIRAPKSYLKAKKTRIEETHKVSGFKSIKARMVQG